MPERQPPGDNATLCGSPVQPLGADATKTGRVAKGTSAPKLCLGSGAGDTASSYRLPERSMRRIHHQPEPLASGSTAKDNWIRSRDQRLNQLVNADMEPMKANPTTESVTPGAGGRERTRHHGPSVWPRVRSATPLVTGAHLVCRET